MKMNNCYKCNTNRKDVLSDLFGYVICNNCIKELKLHSDKTILRNRNSFQEAHKLDTNHPTYIQKTQEQLDAFEKKYISGKIKLLHILRQLNNDNENL